MAEGLIAAVRFGPSEEPVAALLAAPHVAADKDRPGSSGVNALGLAVWRNHAGLVEALLQAGADPDAPDGESGWAPLHRALHWGQLRCAAALLRADASLRAVDWRSRTPLDLLSAELKEYLEPGGDGDVFAWGNGNNYTLGTGSTDVQLHPARVESLHDQQVVAISAAKFHSAAVTVDGRLLTWGWGRGGRLGHPESHIHSGEGAVIAPLAVAALGRRQVAAVAAGKHHTLLCTTAGEVFSFGSNRHGQLGYAVDSQPTPRRVSSLRQRVVAVAAANKHSVAVTAGGDVYTWGCNELGQLGYGTSDSSSNAAPRLVEAMRGKPVAAAAAAKRHTLVLTAAGEVYTWGHRGVSPRRVQLAGARDAASLDGCPITFHRGHADVARPVAAAITAGAAHSSALTSSGVVLCWRSADPALQVQEVGGALAGKRVVAVAAGKYRHAAVSDEGDVFMWEGRSDYFPAEGRQPGSGSKKPPLGSASKKPPLAGSASKSKSRPIPLGERPPLGGEAPLAGSYGAAGSADVAGGSWGSHSRRPGSWIERFAREREAAGASGVAFGSPGSYGASARLDPSCGATPGSGGKSRASDTFEQIRPERVEGLKRAAAVAVGEKHSLAVQRWSAAQLEGMARVPWLQEAAAAAERPASAAAEAAEEDAWFTRAADGLMEGGALHSPREESEGGDATPAASPAPARPSPMRPGPRRERLSGGGVGAPSLQAICEEEVARRLVDPRTCLQVLEYADVAGAEMLRAYCLSVAVCNLDAVLLEAGGAFEELAPHLLAELERLYKLRLAGAGGSGSGVSRALDGALQAAEPAGPAATEEGSSSAAKAAPRRAGSRLQPGRRPTAAAPWLGDEGLEGFEGLAPGVPLPPTLSSGGSSFIDRSQADAAAAAQRLQRTLQKKLQQIEHLAEKAAAGGALDAQQRAKLEQRPVIVSALAALEGGMAPDDVQSILRAASASREAEAEAGASGGSSAAAAGSAAKHHKAKQPKRSAPDAAPPPEPASSSSTATAAAPAALEAADSSALLGSSPPASSLVPAFGLAGSAAAAASPPAAFSPATSPPAQMRSQVGFAAGADGVAAQQGQAPPLARPSSGKPRSAAKRKGGLSMFLRGELEQAAPAPAGTAEAGAGASGGPGVPPAPAPAWGVRPAAPAEGASLKDILDQETAGSASKPPAGALRTTPGSGVKSRPALDSPGPAGSGGPLRLSLASFMQSSPVAVQRGQQQQQQLASPPPPAWGGATGASPPSRQTSFRAIQEEQQAAAPPRPALGTSPPAVQRLGAGLPPWRPPAPPSQPAGPSLLGTSPSASGSLLGSSPLGRTFLAAPQPQHSKWYIPEESRADTRKSLLDIQTEEFVKGELAKQYGEANVRVVGKTERRASGGGRGGGDGAVGAGKAERRPSGGRGGAAAAAATAAAAADGEAAAGGSGATSSGGQARLPRPSKQQQQRQRQQKQRSEQAELPQEQGQQHQQARPRHRQRRPQRTAEQEGQAQQEPRPKQQQQRQQQQRPLEQPSQAQKQQRPRSGQQQRPRPEQHQQHQPSVQEPLAQQDKLPPPNKQQLHEQQH